MRTPDGMHPPLTDLPADAASDVATVAKGGAIQIVGQVTHRSLAFFFTVIAARSLGPAGYGLYQVIVQLLEFLSQLGLLGFNYATLRFVGRARVHNDPGAVRGTVRVALRAASLASGFLVIVVLISAGWVGEVFADSASEANHFALLLRTGILFVPAFACMQVLRYATQAYKTMVPSVIVGNVVQPSLRLVAATAFLASGFGVTAVVASDVISMTVAAVVAVFLYRRILTEEEREASPSASTRPIIRFALPQSGAALLGLQSLGLGVVLLGLLGTNEGAGLFAIALALQGPADLTLSGIINIWAPMVTDLHDTGAIGRLDSLFKTVTRWIATGALPISVAIVIEAELFATIVGGSEAIDAAPIIAILAIGNVLYTCTGPTASLLSMSGHPGVNFLDSLVGVIAYAVLGWIVIPRHGAIGMAWVHAGVTAAVNLTRVVQGKILVGVQPFGRSLLKPVGATVAGAASVLTWKLFLPDTIPFDIAGLALGAAIYLGILKLLGVDEEERYVWALMKRRVFRLRARR